MSSSKSVNLENSYTWNMLNYSLILGLIFVYFLRMVGQCLSPSAWNFSCTTLPLYENEMTKRVSANASIYFHIAEVWWWCPPLIVVRTWYPRFPCFFMTGGSKIAVNGTRAFLCISFWAVGYSWEFTAHMVRRIASQCFHSVQWFSFGLSVYFRTRLLLL